MPYIITPGIQTTDVGTNFDSHAVETIEDAREYAWEESKCASGPNNAAPSLRVLCEEIPETGGMIGPLPDGYVIDVRRVTWAQIMDLAGMDWPVARRHAHTYISAAWSIGDYAAPILETFNGGARA